MIAGDIGKAGNFGDSDSLLEIRRILDELCGGNNFKGKYRFIFCYY